MSDTAKFQRQNKATEKERFNGFLDKANIEWLRQQASEEERSVASFLNRLIRRTRQEGNCST